MALEMEQDAKIFTDFFYNNLPPLTIKDFDSINFDQCICRVSTLNIKFFWYIFEGQAIDNKDYMFYGWIDGVQKELGFFLLSELIDFRNRYGLKVEYNVQNSMELTEVNFPFKKIITYLLNPKNA